MWSTIVGAKVLLALVAGAVTAARARWIDRPRRALPAGRPLRARPAHPPLPRPDGSGPSLAARSASSSFLTFRIGAAATGQWQSWLLFRHGPDLDQRVPELGGDLGYYLFDLPFLTTVSSWIRQLLLLTLILTAFSYAVSGGLRLPIGGRRSARPALAHLGLIAAALAAAQALDYVFVRRPALATSTRAARSSAPATPSSTSASRRRGCSPWSPSSPGSSSSTAPARGRWRPALIALAVWAVLQLVLGVAAPWLVQRYIVAPAEAARELPYLDPQPRRDPRRVPARHRRPGRGRRSPTASAATPPPPLRSPATCPASRCSTPSSSPARCRCSPGTTATRITDVDLDRYQIEGETRPVFVAPRNASRNDLPETGLGAAAPRLHPRRRRRHRPADVPDPDGRPDVDALATTLVPERPELYFGENLAGWYAIVGTKRVEQGGATFDADTGIPLSSLWRRAVLALSTGEIEPLFSAELTSDSQLLYRRDVVERLQALAPFLTFGNDPYPVVLDDRVVWVLDGYTTSSSYPYSQYVGLGGVPVVSSDRVNYLHGSVKATVDAYDGTVHLYRTAGAGADDPVLDAWDEIFPGLLEPISAMPAELAEHQRYPAALIQAQTALLGKYHVADAETLFSGTARWTPVGRGEHGRRQVRLRAGAGGLDVPSRASTLSLGGHWVATLPFSPGTAPSSSTARDELAAHGDRRPRRSGADAPARRRARSRGDDRHAVGGAERDRRRPRAGPAVHPAQRQRLDGAVRTDDACARRRRAGVGALDHRHRRPRTRRCPGSTACRGVRRARRPRRHRAGGARRGGRPGVRRLTAPAPTADVRDVLVDDLVDRAVGAQHTLLDPERPVALPADLPQPVADEHQRAGPVEQLADPLRRLLAEPPVARPPAPRR